MSQDFKLVAISKEDFNKYFNSESIVSKEKYENYIKLKGDKLELISGKFTYIE